MNFTKNDINSYVRGFIVGDIMGVPFDFMDSETISFNPCVGQFLSGGYNNQPLYSWSENTSLLLATMQGIYKEDIDFEKIMNNFCNFYKNGQYTTNGKKFNIGQTTRKAILKYIDGEDFLTCGNSDIYSNGSGALTRAGLLTFFLRNKYGNDIFGDNKSFDYVKTLSMLTHSHMRGIIACGIYISLLNEILNAKTIISQNEIDKKLFIINNAFTKVRKCKGFGISDEIEIFDNIDTPEYLLNKPFYDIEGMGYVVDTLKIALIAFIRYDNGIDAINGVINEIGHKADTNAAIIGSIFNLYKYDINIENLYGELPTKSRLNRIISGYANRLLKE